jgi:hypothetical protein
MVDLIICFVLAIITLTTSIYFLFCGNVIGFVVALFVGVILIIARNIFSFYISKEYKERKKYLKHENDSFEK